MDLKNSENIFDILKFVYIYICVWCAEHQQKGEKKNDNEKQKENNRRNRKNQNFRRGKWWIIIRTWIRWIYHTVRRIANRKLYSYQDFPEICRFCARICGPKKSIRVGIYRWRRICISFEASSLLRLGWIYHWHRDWIQRHNTIVYIGNHEKIRIEKCQKRKITQYIQCIEWSKRK